MKIHSRILRSIPLLTAVALTAVVSIPRVRALVSAGEAAQCVSHPLNEGARGAGYLQQ